MSPDGTVTVDVKRDTATVLEVDMRGVEIGVPGPTGAPGTPGAAAPGTYNVRNYGALGNGTADDLPAITAALAAIPLGSTLYFPAGTYKVNGVIAANRAIRWSGDTGATIRQGTNGVDGWLLITANGTVVDGLTLDSGLVGRGIVTVRADDVTLIRLTLTGWTGAYGRGGSDSAIKFDTGVRGRAVSCYVHDWGYADTDAAQLPRAFTTNNNGVSDVVLDGNRCESVRIAFCLVGFGHRVVNNVCHNVSDNGAYVISTGSSSGGLLAGRIHFAGNLWDACEEGIVLSGADEASTDYLESVEIIGDTFRAWTNRAIAVDHRLRDLAVIGCTFVGTVNSQALQRRASTATTLFERIRFVGNTVSSPVGAFADVYLENLRDSVFAENTINVNHAASEHLFRFEGTTRRTRVADNVLVSTGATVFATRWSGNFTDCEIGRNLLSQTQHFTVPAGVNVIAGGLTGSNLDQTIRREFYATAAPTVGTWDRGDRCWNSTPSASGVPGWICVTAGTPGTWKAMAVLAP